MGTLYAATTQQSVGNTTTETSLFPNAITLPPEFMVQNSQLRITILGGMRTKSATPGTLLIRCRWSNVLFNVLWEDSTYTPTVHTPSFLFKIESYILCTAAGASGTLIGQYYGTFFSGSGAADVRQSVALIPVTIDTTQAAILDITTIWQTADVGNVITTTHCAIEVISDPGNFTGPAHIPP